ncbi:MAG: hypothetical protein E7462_05935, partial [Ruminococcaceae bacterium]|nr:hypothetical protein [Oscillospiraceae bacterium]
MKNTKRILSIFLCLALVIGFIPTFTTLAKAAEETITYSFAKETSKGTELDATSLKKAFDTANPNSGLQSATPTKIYSGNSSGGAFQGTGFLKTGANSAVGKMVLVFDKVVSKVEITCHAWSTSNSDTVKVNGSATQVAPKTNQKTDSLTFELATPSDTVTIDFNKRVFVFAISVTVDAGDASCEHTNTELRNDEPATCTAAGYTGDVYCADCGAKQESGTEIPALGHKDENADKFCDTCQADLNVPTFYKVTSAADLAAGDTIIIVAAGSNFALSTTQNSNNRGQADITKNENLITLDTGSAVQILTLEAGTKDGTFAFNTGSGYLYAASTGSNYMRTQDEKDDNASWTISITTDGVATIKAQGTNTKNWLRHNSSSKIFSCYSSGQADVAIYKLFAEDTCFHEDKTYAPIETDAFHHSVACADCTEYSAIELHNTLGTDGACSLCGAANEDMDALRAAYIDDAYALAVNESLPFAITLTGKITEIDTAWSDQYSNISVVIAVDGKEAKPILCFRLKSNGTTDAKNLKVGDIITATGTLTRFSDTVVEFKADCVLDYVQKHTCEYAEWLVNENNQHYHICTICGEPTDPADHIDEDANYYCDTCEKICCDHDYSVITHPGYVHTEACSKCGTVKTENEYKETYKISLEEYETGHRHVCSCGWKAEETLDHVLNIGTCECGYSILSEDTMVSENLGLENDTEFTETTIADGNITITAVNGTGNNPPKYFTSGTAIRLYGYGTKLTITPAAGYTIARITFTTPSGTNAIANEAVFTNATATGMGTNTTIAIPEKGNEPVVLTNNATSGHYKIESIMVEYTVCEHSYDEGVVTDPTCTEAGEKKQTCANCGDVVTEVIAATGHTEAIDEAKAPTCTETGLTEGKHCSVCGEVLVAQEEVAATGHAWGEGVYTDPTTEADG